MKKWFSRNWDELAVYGFTVLCAFLGDYIIHKTPLQLGWLPVLAAMVSAAVIVLAVDIMQGVANTPEKLAGKRSNFKKRMLISSLAGICAGTVIPALAKSTLASIGISI